MTDHSRIPLAGVLGLPIAHSRSPVLHGHWLKRYGIQGHYVPIEVHTDDLEEVLAALPKAGFVGVNVTIPHKETVLRLADEVTDRARAIGAANTLTFGAGGKIHADNTDGHGFIANIRQSAPDWSASAGPAAVFGAGGASRAVVLSLLDAGAPEVRLTNRSRERADILRQDFGDRVVVWDWADAADMIAGAVTVVNTTSLGMSGKSEFGIPLDRLSAGALATDIVYTPLKTGFLQDAEARGAQIVDGLGMLLHQAAPGFARWFGKAPEIDEDLRRAVLAA